MRKRLLLVTVVVMYACNGMNSHSKDLEVDSNVMAPVALVDSTTSLMTSKQQDSIEEVRFKRSLHNGLTDDASEAFNMLHVVFEGMPDEEKIRPLVEGVMRKYDVTINNENVKRVGSMLISLKKSSAIGVTEMEILKHIYQTGSTSIELPEQAALSSILLEQYK